MEKSFNKYIGISFYLLAVLLFSFEGSITNFGLRLNLLLGVSFTSLSLLTYFPVKANLNLKIQFILHSTFSILFLIVCPTLMRLPLLALLTFILYILLNRKNKNYPELVILAISSLAFFIYFIIYNYSSNTWYAIQAISHALSKFCSSILQIPINSNPTYTGINISIFFLVCSICILWFLKRKRLPLFLLSLIYIALITFIYPIIQLYFSRWISQNYHSFYVDSMNAQAILFILLTPLILFLLSKIKSEEFIKLKGNLNRKSLIKIPVFLALFLSIFILTFQPPEDSKNKNVLFYNKGYLDWRLPNHNIYGAKNGGMFGMFPLYLEANNYLIKHDSLINKQSLSDINILVIINLLQEFSNTEKQMIWEFVDKGGSLFVLGDHTGFKQIREPTNDLLKPFQIELNFDCAIPFTESWRNSLNYFPHPINSSISSNYESNIFIGASLKIGPRARPLIAGMFGFSDPGDINNAGRNGYLGDMKYAQGEQLGDQVLVAESFYGKGKVLVFGDTSPFQNSALVQSHAFVNNVFNWLSSPLNWWNKNSIFIFFFLLTLSFIAIAWLKFNLYDYTIISILICIAIFINTSEIKVRSDFNKILPNEKKLAIINASNLERFSFDQWKGNGYGGLCYNLMREGYMPLINTSGISESLKNSKLLVLIAPAKPFKHSDILILDNYVRNGGFILITSGWEESYGSLKLLENFGLYIENIPLGKIDSDQNKKMITFTKAWGLSSSDTNAKVLCEVWGQPTILFEPIGEGGILLIGDSEFLLNNNLEGMEGYNLQNILFVKEMIEKYINKK